MNRQEHLLTILQEECAEVIQAVSKIKRFGLNSVQPSSGKSNFRILTDELNDVLAMIEMVKETIPVLTPDLIKIDAKKKKVEEHLEYSKKAGTLC